MLIQQFCECGRPKMSRQSKHCRHCNGKYSVRWSTEDVVLLDLWMYYFQMAEDTRRCLMQRHTEQSFRGKIFTVRRARRMLREADAV